MRNFNILVGGLLTLILILAAPPAHANGQAMVECDNCTTVSGFRQEARGLAIQWSLPAGNYLFAILNQQDKLLGQIKVIRDYEAELGQRIRIGRCLACRRRLCAHLHAPTRDGIDSDYNPAGWA